VSVGPAFDAKEQVRQSIDIVELIGNYVQLRRQGRNYVGLCPWHDDSRPSLQVNAERQSFKCWVCDIGGDVFSFVMKMENMEFREALELLAERAGVSLEPARPSDASGHSSASAATSDKRTLLRVMAWAEEQFHHCLVEAPEAEVARNYLVERGISIESVRRFHLGFSPNRWDWLLERARGTEWTSALLERVGLIIRRDIEGTYYDRFRGRVMFSIRDARSRPIAFGGRVLPQLADDRSAKYVNSPETPLFSKSRELYGLDIARDAIARLGNVIVMEGYTDCLMAHQCGLTNVVAVLGTALGDGHVRLLRRFTDSITLVLDGDDAGRRRTIEIIDSLLALFVTNQIDLKILTLPEGVDPCDFIATQGSDAFRQLLSGAIDALDHKFLTVTNGLDAPTDTHRASPAVEQVLSTLALIRPTSGQAASATLLREQQMLGRIARRFHLPEEQLRNRLVALRRKARSRPTATRTEAAESGPPPRPFVALPACDRDLLELILLEPGCLPRIESAIDRTAIESEAARRIFDACARLVHGGQSCDFQRLSLEFDDSETKNLLVTLVESSQAKASADQQQWLHDLIASAERRRDDRRHRLALDAAHHDRDDAETLLARFYSESRAKQLSELERRKK
jgi:DNA primase